MVVPEISKFETKIVEFEVNRDQNGEIIRRFDEHLLQKSDKIAIGDLYVHIRETCLTSSHIDKFMNK